MLFLPMLVKLLWISISFSFSLPPLFNNEYAVVTESGGNNNHFNYIKKLNFISIFRIALPFSEYETLKNNAY